MWHLFESMASVTWPTVIDLLKLAFLVIVALLTAWLTDHFTKKRRGDRYKEILYQERFRVYKKLWQQYVRVTRLLGTKAESISVSSLKALIGSRQSHLLDSNSALVERPHFLTDEELVALVNQVETFLVFTRGCYVFLDNETVHILERTIRLIEGDSAHIDWGELHKRSAELSQCIRRELGIEKLRDLEEIFGSG